VSKYLRRRAGPPSQSWRTFLTNHVSELASIDFFTVPTATLRVLFVFVVLSHDRRRIVHVNVTAHPTAAWTAQQLREAWPWDTAPPFVIRDRDAIYGSDPRRTLQHMGIEDVLQRYLAYYHEWRTHLSLDKDAPVHRPAQPPPCGTIVAVPHVGGLHHHYERRAA
jgi:putative transposase